MLTSLLREPFVHFLLLGAALGASDLLQKSCLRGSRTSPGQRGGCLGFEFLGTCSIDGAANFAMSASLERERQLGVGRTISIY